MRRSLLAVVFVAGVAMPLLADYQSRFRDGITAIDRKRWAEAAAAMRDAISENPSESQKKVFIYGTRYIEYTPHYYLGYALSRSNNCTDAVPALRKSEEQGVIKRTASYRELQRILSACGAPAVLKAADEPAKPPVVIASTMQLPDPAPAQVTQREPEVPQTLTPQPAQTQPAPAVVTPKPSPAPLEPAIVNTVDPQLAAARDKLATLLAESRRLINTQRVPASARASRDALERAINAATTSTTSTSMGTLQAATVSLNAASAEFRRVLSAATDEPDAQLAEAVRAYVRGDFKRAATLLDGTQFASAPARAQAALFRAAARYALFTLDGEKSSAMRGQIMADLREYRRFDARQPDPRLFPPPFRRLYAEAAR